MKITRVILLAVGLAIVGCTASSNEDAAQRPRRQQNVLTQEEIRSANHTNVYDVVAALRSNWINQRGSISFSNPNAGQVQVFMYGQRVGGPEFLRQLNVNDVTSLAFLNPSEAAARFGLQSGSGPAIVVEAALRN